MKKLKLLFLILVGLFVATAFYSCEKPCEKNNTGDLELVNGENWSSCYTEIEWPDGGETAVTISYSKTFYDVPAGRVYVYMTWEDDYYYYYDAGYIDVYQCELNTGYMYWSKKSANADNKGLIITESTMKKKM